MRLKWIGLMPSRVLCTVWVGWLLVYVAKLGIYIQTGGMRSSARWSGPALLKTSDRKRTLFLIEKYTINSSPWRSITMHACIPWIILMVIRLSKCVTADYNYCTRNSTSFKTIFLNTWLCQCHHSYLSIYIVSCWSHRSGNRISKKTKNQRLNKFNWYYITDTKCNHCSRWFR